VGDAGKEDAAFDVADSDEGGEDEEGVGKNDEVDPDLKEVIERPAPMDYRGTSLLRNSPPP